MQGTDPGSRRIARPSELTGDLKSFDGVLQMDGNSVIDSGDRLQ